MFKTIKSKRNTPLAANDCTLMLKGQVILEFTFCMIVILIMIYGVIKVFHWAGRDIVERRRAYDAVLNDPSLSPREQIQPFNYAPVKMNAIWDGR